MTIFSRFYTTAASRSVLYYEVSALLVYLLIQSYIPVAYSDVPIVAITCMPPCSDGQVICTWNDGGNGYNGSTDCQRHCGPPVGSGSACKASSNGTCYWAWTKDAGWACYSGPPPCVEDDEIIVSAYLTCADIDRGYGGCTHLADCTVCCSGQCHCKDLEEGKSVCECGKK